MPKENYQNKMPGVYIEEISSGSNPIIGVSTSTAAFIGTVVNSTQYSNEPKLITSWDEFVATYGSSNNESDLFQKDQYLSYAVHCFFNEGGTRCYIINESHVSEEESFSVQKKKSLENKAVTLTVTNLKTAKEISFHLVVDPSVSDSENLIVNYNQLTTQYSNINGITGGENGASNLIQLKIPNNNPTEPTSTCDNQDIMLPPYGYPVGFCYSSDSSCNDRVSFCVQKIPENEDLLGEKVELTLTNLFIGEEDKSTFTLTVTPEEDAEGETLQIAFDELNTKEYSDDGISGGYDDNGSSMYVQLKRPPDSPMLTDEDENEETIPNNETEVAFVLERELTSEEYLNIILENLKKIDDINIIAFPDMVSSSDNGKEYIKLGYEYCFEEKYCFYIIDPPNIDKINDLTKTDGFIDKISKYELKIDNSEKDVKGSQVNKYSAIYFPWLKIANPIYNPYASDTLFTDETIMVPPSGAIAGIYARTDANRGVWKAPAGLEDGRINCAQDVEATFSLQDYGILNGYNINAIRPIKGAGVCVWGARTVAFVSEGEQATKNSEWRYISVRRLFNYVEDSLHQNLQWAVFEPNGPELWGIVNRNITAFLTDLWKAGAFVGKKPEEAFFIKVDEDNNPPEIRDEGILIIEVGIAPIKPAEFIIIQIRQMTLPG